MSYQKQNFANGEVLNAYQLNHIEDGISALEDDVTATKGDLSAETSRAEKAEQALSARTDALESCGFVVVDGKVCIRYMKKS